MSCTSSSGRAAKLTVAVERFLGMTQRRERQVPQLKSPCCAMFWLPSAAAEMS